MINKIKIGGELSKYWSKDEIAFTSGINVIYGPNGSGKTFLLDILSHYTFISTKDDRKKGWSSIINFSDTGFISSKYNFSMEDYLASRGFGCEVDWDGVAAYRTNGLASTEYLNRKVSEIMCGCPNTLELSYESMKKICINKLSQGQAANIYVDTLMNLNVPDLSLNSSDRWDVDYENFLPNYVINKSRDGKPTLLIDEIDKSFDIDNLISFWVEKMPILAEKYQVIIITHNPLFIDKNVNIIGRKNYEKTMAKIRKFI